MGEIRIETGANLRAWRKRSRLTQRELSEMTGVSKFRISHVESNNEPVSKKLLEAVREVDRKIHPKQSLLSKAWEDVLQTDCERNCIFEVELQAIEKGLVDIFNHIPKGFERKKAYLSVLQIWINSFVEIQKVIFEDTDNFEQKANGVIVKLRERVIETIKGI